MEDATRALELKVIAPEIRTPDDIHGAIEVLANARVDLVIVLQTAMILSERRRVAELMAAKRLPAIYGYRDHVDDGGLINVNWIFRRSAIYVHKILSGDAPSVLPVEFPTRLEMVVNLSRQGNRVRDSRVVSHSARRRSDRIIQLRRPCFAIRESVELPEWVLCHE